MSRWCGVISEAEYRQRECIHRLERIDPVKEHGFRWHCVLCGTFLYRKNGVVVRDAIGPCSTAKVHKGRA